MKTLYLVRKALGEIKKKQFVPGAAILQDTELRVLAVYEHLEEAKEHLERLKPSYYSQRFPNGFYCIVEEYYVSVIEAESFEAYENGEWDIAEQIAYTKEVDIREEEDN